MTTPDHTLTDAEREAIAAACDAGYYYGATWVRFLRNGGEDMLLPALEAILAARLTAVEAVRDHYAVLAGMPVSSSDVADRLDVARGGDDD